jgi:hypothetical protein
MGLSRNIGAQNHLLADKQKRDKVRQLEERCVILSGIVDTERLQLRLPFLHRADALGAAPPNTDGDI